jgi:two-component system, sensor histidine kinase
MAQAFASHPDRPPNAMEMALLTESVRSRVSQARLAFISSLVSLLAFSTLLIPTVPWPSIAAWYVPVLLALLWRVRIASRFGRISGTPDDESIRRFDRQLRANSIINQALVGTGIWTVAPFGNEITPYFVTLVISLFGMGAAVSLVNDFRTVAVSLPILFGQCILFWLLQGWSGLHVSLPLATILILVMTFARQTQRIHNDSIAIRFENDELLAKLERERTMAVEAQREAEQANRSKSRFLAAASHDLRQPLYAVSMLRDTLAMHDLPDRARKIVEQQGVALDVLAHLFDNLLQISRFESGSVEVRSEPIQVLDLLRALADEVRPECERKGLNLDVRGDRVTVTSDPDLLGRLLRNLLSNAVRYTERGGVALSCRRNEEWVELAISDSGAGIPAEEQQRVFQEFVQLDNPQRDRNRGVGLGLSIVRHISKLLDVDVHLKSAEHQGTTVLVRLSGAGAADCRPVADDLPAPAGPISAGYVWIVEDDQLVRDAFDSHLEVLGIRHDFAESIDQLRELSQRRGWPDFAIVDDMLGGSENGLEIARWLAAHVDRDRILIATGNSDPERLEELEASPFAVMRKPISSETMVRWMSRPN